MEIFGTTKKIMLWKITLWKFMLEKGLLYMVSRKKPPEKHHLHAHVSSTQIDSIKAT